MKRSRMNRRKPDPGPPCGKCDPDNGTANACRGCRASWGPPKPRAARKPIKAKTTAQGAIEREYSAEREYFLEDHRSCEIRYNGDRQCRPCSHRATQVHHVVDRGKARWLIADRRNFAATCEECHEVVTHIDIPWSKANGFYLPPVRFPDYELAHVGRQTGSLFVILDDTSDMALATGEVAWPEQHVLAWAAGKLTTEELSVKPRPKIRYRNGIDRDNRLSNLIVGGS